MGSIAKPTIDSPLIEDFKPRIDHKAPLKLAGVLDQYEQFDPTPIIGTEFPKAKLADWMRASNSDELLRDLAITSRSFNVTSKRFSEYKSQTNSLLRQLTD